MILQCLCHTLYIAFNMDLYRTINAICEEFTHCWLLNGLSGDKSCFESILGDLDFLMKQTGGTEALDVCEQLYNVPSSRFISIGLSVQLLFANIPIMQCFFLG